MFDAERITWLWKRVVVTLSEYRSMIPRARLNSNRPLLRRDITVSSLYWIVALAIGLNALLISWDDVYAGPIESPAGAPLRQSFPPDCNVTYSDVELEDFYCTRVRFMTQSGAITGYADGTFRGDVDVTRGQFAKMTVIHFNIPRNTSGGPHFVDVPTNNPFYEEIETAYNTIVNGERLINGYDLPGGGREFRWGNGLTRGQMTKIVTNAAGYGGFTPSGQSFADVPGNDTWWIYVERARTYNVLGPFPPWRIPPADNRCTTSTACYYPYSAVTRADAAFATDAAEEFRFNGPGVSGVFAQKDGNVDDVTANMSTPAENSTPNHGIPPGQTIAGVVGATARWNPYFAEAGAQAYRNLFGVIGYHPYWSWGADLDNQGGRLETNIRLPNPPSADRYRAVKVPGSSAWQMQHCPSSGCYVLGTSAALPAAAWMYGVAAAETNHKPSIVGPLTASYFTVSLVNQSSSFLTCYDRYLTPWRSFTSLLDPCNPSQGAWTMTARP